MRPEKIHVTQEKETMLMTLYARALQSGWQNPILPDRWAEDAVVRIEHDFSKFKVGKIGAMITAIRAKNFDLLTTQYFIPHPDAIVLHLGCGMDSRFFRVDPPASVSWFDVDYPEVIELRRRLYPERPEYHLIESALPDLNWLEDIPRDRPSLIIAEGLLMFLTEADVKILLNGLTAHFPSGQIMFDALNPFAANNIKNIGGTGASYKWGLDDPHRLQKLAPKLNLNKEFETPELVDYPRLPLAIRMIMYIMDVIPGVRRMNRLLVYRF